MIEPARPVSRAEKASGARRDGRSELQILLDFLRQGDTLVVTRIDRLARLVKDLQDIVQELKAKGVALKAIEQPETQQSSSGQTLRTTNTSYTLAGKIAASVDADGNVTRYAYDAVDRLSSVTDPLGRVTSYGYDAISPQIAVFNTAECLKPPRGYGRDWIATK